MRQSKETSEVNGHYDRPLFKDGQHVKAGWINVYIEPANYEVGRIWKTRGRAREAKGGCVAYRIRVKLKEAQD